jgi:hypothetical protein
VEVVISSTTLFRSDVLREMRWEGVHEQWSWGAVQGMMYILANRVSDKNVDGLTGARDVQYEDLHPRD